MEQVIFLNHTYIFLDDPGRNLALGLAHQTEYTVVALFGKFQLLKLDLCDNSILVFLNTMHKNVEILSLTIPLLYE